MYTGVQERRPLEVRRFLHSYSGLLSGGMLKA